MKLQAGPFLLRLCSFPMNHLVFFYGFRNTAGQIFVEMDRIVAIFLYSFTDPRTFLYLYHCET